jgi:hypothetical protein
VRAINQWAAASRCGQYSGRVANEDVELARGYHERTKHSEERLRANAHGRLLRYVVRVRDSLNINVRLVRVGAAAPYLYLGRRGRYASLLERLALRAKGERAWPVGTLPAHALRPEQGRQHEALATGPARPAASPRAAHPRLEALRAPTPPVAPSGARPHTNRTCRTLSRARVQRPACPRIKSATTVGGVVSEWLASLSSDLFEWN